MNNMPDNSDTVNEQVSHLFRKSAGKMTAVLSHFFGLHQLQLIEDIVQETFYTALKSWPARYPPQPEAWLIKVAKNKAINLMKRNKNIRDNLWPKYKGIQDDDMILHNMDELFVEKYIPDSQLRLLVACCHPALSPKNQIIFTLKTLGGFGTTEIASALLIKPEAVRKAYQRTLKWVKENDISLGKVSLEEAKFRLELVHQVLYLIFNEGYKAASGSKLIREELCFEAIRITKIMIENDCCNTATKAMLALMYFNISRSESRVGDFGEVVLLLHQDRSLWDQKLISAGFYWLSVSMHGEDLATYHLEAAIASLHCAAPVFEKTNWQKLLFYYEKLLLLNASPIVYLNYIVAFKMINGIADALQLFNNHFMAGHLNQDHLFYAVKAHLQQENGEIKLAVTSYQQAIKLAKNIQEREFLLKLHNDCERQINPDIQS